MLASILSGLSILVIGDSHLASRSYLIDSLHTNLENQGASVYTIGVCGSKPSDWLQVTPGTCGAAEREAGGEVKVLPNSEPTRPIKQLIETHKPDLVMVVMGDTLGGYEDPTFSRSWAWQQITSLTKEIAKTQTACVWIGPTWGSKGDKLHKTETRIKQVSSFLASNVAPCEYIDSLQLSAPGDWPAIDGQHLNRTGYQAWGDALSQKLLESPTLKKLINK